MRGAVGLNRQEELVVGVAVRVVLLGRLGRVLDLSTAMALVVAAGFMVEGHLALDVLVVMQEVVAGRR